LFAKRKIGQRTFPENNSEDTGRIIFHIMANANFTRSFTFCECYIVYLAFQVKAMSEIVVTDR
jgi:hypothetical protein